MIWPLGMFVPWMSEPLLKAEPALGFRGAKQGILTAVLAALVAWMLFRTGTKANTHA